MRRLVPRVLVLLLAGVAVARAQDGLFESGVATLRRACPPEVARPDELDALAERWRARLPADAGDDAQRAALFGMLGEVETSHLGLYSLWGARRVMRVLGGQAVPTFGLELVRLGDGMFVFDVLEGGPAGRAGVVRGERVLSIDRTPVACSPRLDWRSDDAHLPDWPRHVIRGEPGDAIELTLERTAGAPRTVRLECVALSPRAVDRDAAHAVEHGGHRLGVLHLRYMYADTAADVVRPALEGPLRGVEGLVLDLRGRGGSPVEIGRVAALFDGDDALWRRPLVVLVDRNTRSAKEILAWRLHSSGRARLVGEHTAGAVRPARFFPVGEGAALLVPVHSDMEAIGILELCGVEPDRAVADPLAWEAGKDPILAAGLDALARLCPF